MKTRIGRLLAALAATVGLVVAAAPALASHDNNYDPTNADVGTTRVVSVGGFGGAVRTGVSSSNWCWAWSAIKSDQTGTWRVIPYLVDDGGTVDQGPWWYLSPGDVSPTWFIPGSAIGLSRHPRLQFNVSKWNGSSWSWWGSVTVNHQQVVWADQQVVNYGYHGLSTCD